MPNARPRSGTRLAQEGLALVYGGGNVGLMGIVADAALAAGGEVIGVIPEQLVGWEVAHRGLTRLEVVANMHERKARMFDLSDAFVALPGGFGTLDEMFEMLTWRQLGLGDKPCAFLDVDGFYAPLIAMMDRMVEERFLHADQRRDLWHGEDIDALLAWMRDYRPAQATSGWTTNAARTCADDRCPATLPRLPHPRRRRAATAAASRRCRSTTSSPGEIVIKTRVFVGQLQGRARRHRPGQDPAPVSAGRRHRCRRARRRLDRSAVHGRRRGAGHRLRPERNPRRRLFANTRGSNAQWAIPLPAGPERCARA